jgi:hypothetical protein
MENTLVSSWASSSMPHTVVLRSFSCTCSCTWCGVALVPMPSADGKFVGEFAHASHCGVALVPMPSADVNEGEANELS